mmetsp:Transcript_31794/g.36723  ORF Transcript_31794/g.36723 Transcript_31794/m.36723 type:complete len:185 (-) Transcript_31794:156-710(-)|eukprot:CAMPEP_0176438846 /NCGR_PEP_ID=MMETSP0127-20121128/19557_1 /TAXON_ID=938130 /ORGANISM="Platyophrya macrostoma, Strain WH" /LENGTH=184 /DNA_ID=CAMNT_0017822935 /DNA_START=101 /DNA_END=655 /DNA_ORIENTATION=+
MAPRDITGETRPVDQLLFRLKQRYQRFEDLTVPHRPMRWAAFLFLILFYFIRVFAYGGFYVVTYGMCIHLLYLVMLMITPLSDPEERASDEAQLPSFGSGDAAEFKPFVPKVQEFVVWRSMTRVVLICFTLTMFSVFDIPVFWPILVMYFLILFVSQMGNRIQHMMKHKYVPWSAGKPKFVSKE